MTTQLVIRITGDSGDGVQLVGAQLTLTAALSGKAVCTLPDFPAEIRAPAGTRGGVSGFQLAIADEVIFTAGEVVDVLVAMNPAALLAGISALRPGGLLIINEDSMHAKDWEKARALPDDLESIQDNYQVILVPLVTQALKAVESTGVNHSQAKKAKNFYALGLVLWLFDLPLEQTLQFIDRKFQSAPNIAEANRLALQAGFSYGDTFELSRKDFAVGRVTRAPGTYRQITGIEALTMGMAAVSTMTQIPMLVSGYPITPASGILQAAATLGDYGVHLLQAEDEIAAICACIGAAFGGRLALTSTSGPGFDLKSESLGLAVIAELPLVIVDVQRAGASTGLPTKTGQSDLQQALYGRHGESPIPVIAAISPADCFNTVIEAFRIAIESMTPVIVLLDAYLANAAEPWKLPALESIDFPEIQFNRHKAPFERNEQLSRSWNTPGTPGYIHQLGGLEKSGEWGRVSYDADNHAAMIALRAKKIDLIAKRYAPLVLEGDPNAAILLVSWGSTYGSLKLVFTHFQEAGLSVAWLQLKHVYPLPLDLGEHLKRHAKVFVCELNSGHLCQLLRATYLVDAKPITQCNGQPFNTAHLIAAIQEELSYV